METKLELRLPANRADALAPWLRALDPASVADVLELGQKAYAAVSAALAVGKEPAAAAVWEDLAKRHEEERREFSKQIEKLKTTLAEEARHSRQREEEAEHRGKQEAAAELARLRNSLEEQQECHRLREEAALRAAHDDNEAFRSLIKSCQAEKDRALREAAQHHRESFLRPLEVLTANVASLTAKQGSQATGDQLVYDVHAGLNLGKLVPKGHDHVWCWKSLRTLVEVKSAPRLHSIHDLEHHVAKLSEAASEGTVNSAMFISLKAKVPGKASFAVEFVAGLPVIYVGGASDASAVELAFYAAAKLLPQLVTEGDEHSKQPDSNPLGRQPSFSELAAVKSFVLASCEVLRSLQRRIEDLDRAHESIGNSVCQLKVIKSGLFASLGAVRTAVPALTHEPEPLHAARPCTILTKVCDYYRNTSSWPTQWKDVGLKRDSLVVRAATREKKSLAHFVEVARNTMETVANSTTFENEHENIDE